MDRLYKIIYKNGYLVVASPDGEFIPGQLDLVIKNKVDLKDKATVTVTFLADITELKK